MKSRDKLYFRVSPRDAEAHAEGPLAIFAVILLVTIGLFVIYLGWRGWLFF